MTELEIMQHAKTYVDKLANGIDPITEREVSATDVINNVRISRCLFYVSDVLRQVIENGGINPKGGKSRGKAPFALSFEERAHYPFGDGPATVSVIAQRLNDLVDLNKMQKLKTTSITAFLMQSGILFEEESPSGSKSKRPTEIGKGLGIITDLRTGQNGDYIATVYSREAQQFILDNLDAVIAINAAPRHENQGKPWTAEENAYLQEAVQAGIDVKEMSAELKRSRDAIRARLKKLGLADGGGINAQRF